MLVGHNKQKKYFNNIIANDMLGQAYLFSGPEMIGKKSFALELVKSILGDNFAGNPDFKLIEPLREKGEPKIYIDDIRALKKFFSLKNYGGGRRMVVFDDAHCMTSEAANSFLKILEEPPAGSFIILVSSAPDLLPATILSRCEEVRFVTANDKELDNYLSQTKLNKEDKEFLSKLAGGRIGFLHRLVNDDGIIEARKAVDDLRKLLNSGIYEKMDYAKKVHEKGDYQPKVDYWLNWVSASVRNSPKNEKIVKNLLSLSSILSQSQFNHRLALENFLINL